MFEEPAHRQLQRAPRVEACGARVGVGGSFRLHGRVVLRGKLRLQEREITHGYSCSSLNRVRFVGTTVANPHCFSTSNVISQHYARPRTFPLGSSVPSFRMSA